MPEPPPAPNQLWYGDCLTILREHLEPASVDLIYLDPPFNSNRAYNAIYTDETGRPLPDQIEAFCDLWTLDAERERALRTLPIEMLQHGIADAVVQLWQTWTKALRQTQPRLLAYLSYMVERLVQMKVVLKPTGSLYVHCDPTASHYLKVMLDGIFGHDSFRSEIIWKRTSAHNDAKALGAVHDCLLYYTASGTRTFNQQYTPYSTEYIEKRHRNRDADGRRWMSGSLSAKGLSGGGYRYAYKGVESLWRVPLQTMQELDAHHKLHFTSRGGIRIKRYLDEMKGLPLSDLWTDIAPINSQAKERLGYATQKPLALLERIITASSNPGDVVLDPFCGCATTLEAAHTLGRRWIGIDIAIHAVKRVASIRLQDRLGLIEGRDFLVQGVPRTLEGAHDLWKRDAYHFQKWAVEQVDGFVTTKRTTDGGVDGRLYFAVPGEPELHSMAIEVKGGTNVSITDVRALRGVLDHDAASLAGLIVMEPPKAVQLRNFRSFMAAAGDLDVLGVRYPRMQLLTVAEILDGKRFHTPGVAGRGVAQPALPLGTASTGRAKLRP